MKFLPTKFSYSMLFAIGVAVLALLTTYKRLFYGVDFTDESFYTGIPYEFVLGNRPFIDELNFLTFPSLLLYPVIKLYFLFNEGTDGIILFNRHLFLLFFLLVAFTVFIVSRRIVSSQAAVIIAASSIAFIPLNIPALGYNTMSSGFLTIGLLLSYYAVFHEKKGLPFLLAGLSLGLAVISYPTIIIPFVIFSIILLIILAKKSIIKNFGFFVIGSLIAAVPVLIIMWKAGLDHVLYFVENLGYVGIQGGSGYKLIEETYLWFSNYPNKWVILIAIILVVILYYKKSFLYSFLLLLLPLFSYKFGFDSGKSLTSQSQIVVVNYSVLFLLLFFIHVKDKKIRYMGSLIFLPSLLAGLTYMWSSSNGYIASGLGLFPACIATSLAIVYSIENSQMNVKWRTLVSILAPLTLIIYLVLAQQNHVYRDQDIQHLTSKVTFGPYKGLYTTPEKIIFMEQLSDDLIKQSKDSKSVFFYNHFPGGYLFSGLKPGGNTIWIFYYSKNRYIHVDYYENNNQPDVIFRMKNLFDKTLLPLRYYKKDELNNFVKENYIIEDSNEYYDVLKKK